MQPLEQTGQVASKTGPADALAEALSRLRAVMLYSQTASERADFAALRALPAGSAQRLELQALELLHQPPNSSGEAQARLGPCSQCVHEAQALGEPFAEAAAWRALHAQQIALKLFAAALHSNAMAIAAYERARAGELVFALQAQRCTLLYSAEMFKELREHALVLLQEAERLVPAQRHQVLNCAASAAYYLALELDEQEDGSALRRAQAEALWQECLARHAQALALAESMQAAIPLTVSRLNLAIVSATRGELELCSPQLAALEQEATDALPGCQSWIAHCRLLMRCHGGPSAEVWEALQTCLDDDETGLHVAGLREARLRALEHFAMRWGHVRTALAAAQARLALQQRQTRELGLTLGQTVHEVMEHPRLLRENEHLARHGDALQHSLLERNAELQRALVKLQAEVLTRHAAEQGLQQTHDELERQVAQRSAELNRAMAQLMAQERQLALSRMIAGLAHEMNTPLDTARMSASAVQDSSRELRRRLDEGSLRRGQLEQLQTTLAQALSLMQRGLERVAALRQRFASVKHSDAQEQLGSLDAAALLRSIAAGWQTLLHQRSVRLQVDLPEQAWLLGNRDALQQVLQQLMENSLQHGLAGRSDGQLSLSLRDSGEHWTLIWSDNGCGIEAANLPRVFEPFFTTQLGRSGTGLGLSCVHSLIVDLMGGTLSLQSLPGQGSAFSIQLRKSKCADDCQASTQAAGDRA